MSSYSGLAYLSTHDMPEDLSTDKVQEIHDDAAEEPPLPILPKGAHTGNVVHDLLEHNTFSTMALITNHNDLDDAHDTHYEHYLATQEKACLRYGLEPIENAPLLNTLLQQTVTTALSTDDNNFTLANLDDSQCLKEMPFYFAVEQLNTLAINQALHGKEAFQPLSYKTIKGQLTGFIDLVCEYQGRYYVMDYKTNYLPEYSQQNMLQAMTAHNYGLQYWLYSVVLHRYLQQRLASYDFQQHFGGVRYLFVRGMQTSEPMSGVYSYQPDEETIEALAAALVG
jgi:exodeoxyribonuclease V beta subunit